MGVEHLLAFNLALLAALASPGPALLLALRNTLQAGQAAGIATGAGLAVMAAGWTLAALFGLETVFTLFPWAYTAVKVAGALYLLHIAWQTWRGARAPLPQAQPRAARNAFLSGLAVNILNPKSVLFAAAVLVVIFPAGLSLADKLLIAANHLVVEIVAYTLLATALSRSPVRTAYLGAKPGIDRVTALILGGLGTRILIDR